MSAQIANRQSRLTHILPENLKTMLLRFARSEKLSVRFIEVYAESLVLAYRDKQHCRFLTKYEWMNPQKYGISEAVIKGCVAQVTDIKSLRRHVQEIMTEKKPIR